MKGIRPVSLIVMAISVAVLAMTAATSIALAKNPNPRILPPNASPYTHTYSEWAAKFWQWTLSLPADHHPLFDTADCSAGQSGKVWFIDGTLAPTSGADGVYQGIVTRDCTVPAGKALFFPIITSECSTLEGNGATDGELRDCAKWLQDHAVNLSCEIDGVPVRNLAAYRKQSPLFTYGPLPQNNVLQALGLDAPAGSTSLSVTDGVFLMLAPLSRGKHTIHNKGSVVFTAAEDGFDYRFDQDIAYHLTVGP